MFKTILFNLLFFIGGLLGFTVSSYASPQNANALVSGILSYTSWDSPLEQINFCIADGPAQFITPKIFTPPSPLIRPNNVKIFDIKMSEVLQNPLSLHNYPCHVLYFVNTPDDLQQQFIQANLGRILTISENNTECIIGSAFCLYRGDNDRFNFKVNLTSLKKSNIRVNSKVLMLANTEGNFR